MKVDIGNRWVWITGASSGIGAELSKEAARAGARLLLSGRNTEALAAVAGECETISHAAGRAGGHEVLSFDLLDRAERAAAVQKALAMSGGIALLVLNAGISQRSRFEDLTPEAFDRIMELDFNAPVDIIRRMIPSWGGDKAGTSGILVVSSLAGLIGAPRRSAYAAAKHALTGFASVLRGELIERRVAVTTAFPAYVRTGIGRAALGSDGKARGIDDPDIEGGADPAKVAARLMKAALAGKAEIRAAFTFESHFALFTARRFPGFYARLAARRGKSIARRESEKPRR
ncbi:MAG TPA: SDR family NAD(P)-dependent oxidoreductase [Rectinemataceae bacterium]|nr:SDR family NAD(P)-dependent oxidoreductase [Rectinemataceae bacterium]